MKGLPHPACHAVRRGTRENQQGTTSRQSKWHAFIYVEFVACREGGVGWLCLRPPKEGNSAVIHYRSVDT